MLKRRFILFVVLLAFIVGGCATTSTTPTQTSYQETLVSTYEQFGNSLSAIQPILVSLEATQTLKGDDLVKAKVIYAQAKSYYLQAGVQLKSFINGSSTGETYLQLIQQIVGLINQVTALLPKKTAEINHEFERRLAWTR